MGGFKGAEIVRGELTEGSDLRRRGRGPGVVHGRQAGRKRVKNYLEGNISTPVDWWGGDKEAMEEQAEPPGSPCRRGLTSLPPGSWLLTGYLCADKHWPLKPKSTT